MCNEIEQLTNKLQKVSDDLTKNQQGQHGKCVLFILSCNLQSFVIVERYCYVIHVVVLPCQDWQTIQLLFTKNKVVVVVVVAVVVVT